LGPGFGFDCLPRFLRALLRWRNRRHRRNEPEALAWNGFDEARVSGIVPQSLPRFPQGCAETRVEIYVGVVGPDSLPHLFPGHNLAGALGKRGNQA
jgi:hypothetical protein